MSNEPNLPIAPLVKKRDIIGEYCHVAVSTDIQGAKSSIEFDLDRERMEKIIVDGYIKFKSFDCEQRTFDPADVTQILVYKTKGNFESLQPTDESKRQNKNSDKWNNIVLQYGELMNEHLEIRKPEPSLLEDFRFAKK
jgi:hypothetical protein